ncbi:hypothetical protein [Flavobacterium sp. HJJ]|uniref:hypothetical protein n=1 Tax=Flavobacterium sp. HJJ TaxID=2783792 RepID=UPI00188BB275|nr:hypothetical protein [Flavobacterium sp. HJJ]MBF4472789.1 hypothetical protein [Flavobacterium sp. HJJ]
MYNQLGFTGIYFENKYRFTLNQVAKFYEVDTRTIERILQDNNQELHNSGYEIFRGVKLKDFKDFINQLTDINVGQLMEDNDNELVGKRATAFG